MMKWIAFKDREPPDGKYLVFTTDGQIDINRFINGAWESYINVDVSHWMPLPASPDVLGDDN